MVKNNSYIQVTDIIFGELHHHKDRTGISTSKLLKGKRGQIPKGLNSAVINQVLAGNNQSIKQDYLDCVLNLWRALPEKEETIVKLTDDTRTQIRTAIEQTGRSVRTLFGTRSDRPEGFSRQLLAIMTSHKGTSTKRVKKEYVDYVFAVCDEYESRE